jgi:hypothetical protein
MARHQWTILCSQATVNSLTNNISLIEVIDELTAQVPAHIDPAVGFPADTIVPVFMTVVSSFERDDKNTPERLIGRLSLISPVGSNVDTNFDIDLSAFQRVRCILGHGGLLVRQPGIYIFRIAVQDQSGVFTDVSNVTVELKLAH